MPMAGLRGPRARDCDRARHWRRRPPARRRRLAHGDDALDSVHSPALVHHLRPCTTTGWPAGFVRTTARTVSCRTSSRPPRCSARSHPPRPARCMPGPAQFCYDTMTTARARQLGGDRQRRRLRVDRCRPGDRGRRTAGHTPCADRPGHHVTADAFGGSCYLNNAALAAQALVDGGHERVAIIDIDAHHGNGTAAIFYDACRRASTGRCTSTPVPAGSPTSSGHAAEIGDGCWGRCDASTCRWHPGAVTSEFLDGGRAARRDSPGARVDRPGCLTRRRRCRRRPREPAAGSPLTDMRRAGAILLRGAGPTHRGRTGGWLPPPDTRWPGRVLPARRPVSKQSGGIASRSDRPHVRSLVAAGRPAPGRARHRPAPRDRGGPSDDPGDLARRPRAQPCRQLSSPSTRTPSGSSPWPRRTGRREVAGGRSRGT